jgi:hypothetical protein
MRTMTSDWLIAAGLFVGLVACLEIAHLFGHRARRKRSEHPDQLSTIQGAMLGLLALLLGFSFAMAAGRFSNRLTLISEEANAIGTAWLRCSLLPDAPAREVRPMLRRYTDIRIAYYDAKNDADLKRAIAQAEQLQRQMWVMIAESAKVQPHLVPVLPPAFNEMFDLEASRAAAAQRHLPGMLLLLLLASSVVSVGAVGYGCGVAGKRNVVLTTALSFLIAGVLWAIIDMDHPRKGLIQAGQQPMLELQRSLTVESASP